mmetsp:Transcript_23325/g.36000  ORF Transcript_23325/g.36000 Transcript_23325/m.36000 type:complete len:84 (+) Transcript_23325:48-299(+)
MAEPPRSPVLEKPADDQHIILRFKNTKPEETDPPRPEEGRLAVPQDLAPPLTKQAPPENKERGNNQAVQLPGAPPQQRTHQKG